MSRIAGKMDLVTAASALTLISAGAKEGPPAG